MKKIFQVSALLIAGIVPASVFAQQTVTPVPYPLDWDMALLIGLAVVLLCFAIYLAARIAGIRKELRNSGNQPAKKDYRKIIAGFTKKQIEHLLSKRNLKNKGLSIVGLLAGLLFLPSIVSAQQPTAGKVDFTEGGIVITLILIAIPIVVGMILVVIRMNKLSRQLKERRKMDEAELEASELEAVPEDKLREQLSIQKSILDYEPEKGTLTGSLPPKDERGLLKNIDENAGIRFIEEKRKAIPRPKIDPALSKLVIWYIITATAWLIFGTSVGEYLGIKFVSPDVDHVSWLAFGRLRPVHTNSVFWGWASLGMIGLGYYVVPRVGNNKLYSIKLGWWALILINAAVLIGSICLMAGINNSGGEFREYIWPVQSLFGLGVILSMINYIMTIAKRKTKEIYVSNWYIVAAMMFGITIMLVAYLPWWQNGLGETIAQGYYMHQGVGMWFMMFVLGLIYYFLPQQLNRPIYSYSLGILAFWTQILFYTLIGSHHFVFSSIPWWLQTVAIVGSVGMIIPL